MQRMGKMNLTDAERDKLLTATRSRTARVADVSRAKLILIMEKKNRTDAERDKLLPARRSRRGRGADVRRAKLILMLEEGQSRDTIMQRLECDSRFISRWSSRFL